MDAQDLKNSILQMAIQGKLVEQREEEGTGKELLQKIETEKKQLIKKGMIKKRNSLPTIKEDEIPFDIPENWEWVKLGNLSSLVTKGTTPRGGKVSYLNEGIGFIRAENVAGFDKLDLGDIKYVDEKTHNTFLKRSILEENDILITIAGTLGRTAIVRKADLPLNANQAVSLTRLIKSDLLNLKYLVFAINAPIIQSILTGKKKTTAIPNLTLEIINDCVLPIPPLEEQDRIVEKIEELLPYVDKYDVAYSEVEELNKKFPEYIKKSILQYVVQGKLVEQREEDGTAEDLFNQIQEEKKQLIKEGKIKKSKKLPQITVDEIPFEIPESWKWVRLVEVGEIVGGGTPKTGQSEFWNDGDIPWLTPADMKAIPGKYVKHGKRFITTEGLKKSSAKLMPTGTIIYSSRAPIGYIGIAENGLATNQGFKSLVPYMSRVNEYMYYCLIAKTSEIISRASGTTFKEISGKEFGLTLVPLPPLEEQKRIVAKIEELLPYTQRLVK